MGQKEAYVTIKNSAKFSKIIYWRKVEILFFLVRIISGNKKDDRTLISFIVKNMASDIDSSCLKIEVRTPINS